MPRPTFLRSSLVARRRRPGRVAAALVVLGGAAAASCGGRDPFAPQAFFETQPATFQVYPISLAPSSLPAALNLYGLASVRPVLRSNLSLNFDVGVDIDATGRVRLLPPKLVVSPAGVSLTTGLQVIGNTTFDAFTRAPNSGYQFDSATVVTPGQVIAVQTQGAGPLATACATTTPMYAKLIVDSVRTANGLPLIYMRGRVDQNCGFRSLAPGLPDS